MHLLDEMNREPVKTARLAEGRHAHPTAGVINSQSIKTTESGRVIPTALIIDLYPISFGD